MNDITLHEFYGHNQELVDRYDMYVVSNIFIRSYMFIFYNTRLICSSTYFVLFPIWTF